MTIVYLDDIDRVQFKFTELGQTIEDLSKQHKGYFEDTTKSLSDGFTELSRVHTDPAFSETIKSADILAEQIGQMSELFGKVLTGVSDSFSDLLRTSKESQKTIGDIAAALKVEAEKPGGGSGGGAPAWYVERQKKKEEKAKAKGARLPRLVQRELNTVKGKAGQFLGTLHLPKPGHVMATGVAAMAYGFMYQDRVRKEAGEIKNTLESAFDYGISSVRRKGTAAFSALQENLQRYTGIAKEEVQAITSTFAQGGVGIQEMLATVDKDFGRVGKSAVHSTLALDKMFGVPGGTMAQKAVGYMHNYGMSLEEANEMTRDLHLNDAAFRIGVPTFVNNVETAAEALKDFGFSIRGVMDMAAQLQKGFEAVGVPKQFAGKLAGMGVQQMAQGIANMTDDWKVLMGQKMFGKTGTEALQKFEESYSRVKEGNSVEDYNKLVLTMYQVAKEANNGDESQMYAFLSRNVGLGSSGARATLEIGKVMEEKGGIEAIKATEKHMKTFKDAFETEKEKDSKFRREMNKWMEGISQVGQGILGIVGKFLAHLVAMFRAYPEMMSALMSADFDRLRRIQKKVAGITGGVGQDLAMLKKGMGTLKGAGKQMFGDIFASSIDAMGQAFTADLSGGEPEDKPGPVEDRPPILQPVFIPVGGGTAGGPSAGKSYSASMDPRASKAAQEYSKAQGQYWAGGGLSLISRGVDEHGNLGLEIVGNCPRCGLKFGGGTSGTRGLDPAGAAAGGAYTSMGLAGEGKNSGQDVEAAMRVVQSEQGGKFGGGRKRWEALGILQTLKNRAKDTHKSIYDVATGGSGWGTQGKAGRQYGTARGGKEDKDLENFVRSFLRGDIKAPDELKKARGFWHNKKGQIWKKGDYAGATPAFARKGAGGILASANVGPGTTVVFTGGRKDTQAGAATRAKLEQEAKVPKKTADISKAGAQDQWEAEELARGEFYTGSEF